MFCQHQQTVEESNRTLQRIWIAYIWFRNLCPIVQNFVFLHHFILPKNCVSWKIQLWRSITNMRYNKPYDFFSSFQKPRKSAFFILIVIVSNLRLLLVFFSLNVRQNFRGEVKECAKTNCSAHYRRLSQE